MPPAQAKPIRHPATAGWIAGTMEIGVTFPFEYVKTQLQLQQQASGLYAGEASYRGSVHCAAVTMREKGLGGLYRGGTSWVVFAGPRSAVRFGTFEFLSSAARQHDLHSTLGPSAVDTANGFMAGIAEAAICQTPNQVIAIKMIHDQSPKGPRQYTGFLHCCASMWRASGLLGFFQGLGPACLKGAVTNGIRFLGYGQIKRLIQETGTPEAPPPPLSPLQSMLAGGVAGAVSAVASQPIDTVKANMMGLDAGRYRSALHCTTELVRHAGVRTLFNGVGPRVIRVFIEVGLQFTLFEQVGRLLDDVLPG